MSSKLSSLLVLPRTILSGDLSKLESLLDIRAACSSFQGVLTHDLPDS